MSLYKLTPRIYTNPGSPPRPPMDMRPLVEKQQPAQAQVSFDDPMQHLRKAGTVTISTELFEKMRLPDRYNQLREDPPSPPSPPPPPPPPRLKLPFGNPTPIGVVGIVITVTPLSFNLMGVLGAGGSPSAGIGTFYFFGGMLQIFTALMEWIMGSTFSSVVFAAYGSFFLWFGASLTPSFAAFAPYAPPGADPSLGLESKNFNANTAFIFFWMTVLTLLFLVCSLRTIAVFVVVFTALTGALTCLTAEYFLLAAAAPIRSGNTVIVTAAAAAAKTQAANLSVGAGVCAFIASLAAWYLLASILLETLDFPVKLPVGDLSNLIRPGSQQPRDDTKLDTV